MPETRFIWHSDGLLAARGVAEHNATVWRQGHLGSPVDSIDLARPNPRHRPHGREGNPIASTPERSERPSGQAPDARAQPEKPVPDEHARAKAEEMMTADEDRPTATLPGSPDTVTGTAVNDWRDDEGEPTYGQDGP
ncbi:hypothetical protein MSAR_39720 [Mycolicibacterium sarraceniae]|uniref:Uncharacterized protein n=1 Tax=Mycolicibacterium sarraceniae TaxID=1534348 RepID=A0A7I7SYE2_9MYCO|nr:hypothetical protein MSAR_39720 [Mycolicibacterium sarraceniae]